MWEQYRIWETSMVAMSDARKEALDKALEAVKALSDPEYKEKLSYIFQFMRHQELNEVKWKRVTYMIPYTKVLDTLVWLEGFRNRTWKHSLTKPEIELWNHCVDSLKKLGKPSKLQRKVVPI